MSICNQFRYILAILCLAGCNNRSVEDHAIGGAFTTGVLLHVVDQGSNSADSRRDPVFEALRTLDEAERQLLLKEYDFEWIVMDRSKTTVEMTPDTPLFKIRRRDDAKWIWIFADGQAKLMHGR
jgi:hypothetical protein